MTTSVTQTRIEVLKAAYDAAGERLAKDLEAHATGRAGTRCLSGDFTACNAARNAYEMALKGES